MKSPIITNFIFSLILAVILFFLLPVLVPGEALSANLAIALGVVLGGTLIPLLQSISSKEQSDAEASSSTTLYVGNLPYRANEQAVREHFAEQGTVHSVRLMKDRRTGKRKGYGFVEMDSADAENVINRLNDSEFQERTLKVRLAKEKVSEA